MRFKLISAIIALVLGTAFCGAAERVGKVPQGQQLAQALGTLPYGSVVGPQPISPYSKNVATRGYFPTTSNANNSLMARSGHIFRSNVTSFQVIYGCVYGNPENTTGANCEITAGVENPVGTNIGTLTFGGVAKGVITDGSYIISDVFSATISSGTQIEMRQWLHKVGDAGVVPVVANVVQNAATFHDTMNCGNNVPDTTSGTSAPSDTCSGLTYRPIAIVTTVTSGASVCGLGNSIMIGVGDTPDSSGDMGILARSVGPTLGYSIFAVGGTTATQYNSIHTARQAIFSLACTDIVVEFSVNDLGLGTAAAVLTQLQTLWASLPAGKKVWQTTSTPQANSTDNFATTINQSDKISGKNITLNNSIKGSQPLLTGGYFDVASVLGVIPVSTTPLLWAVNGTPGYCTDTNITWNGIHPTLACYQLVQSSGIIPPASFHFP